MEQEQIEPMTQEERIKFRKDIRRWLYIMTGIFMPIGISILFVPPKNEQDTMNGLKYFIAAGLIGISIIFIVVAHWQKQKIKEETSKPE